MTNTSAKKCVGLSLLASITWPMVCSMPAAAQPQYDKTIAKAAADQVAKRLGELRGGISFADEVILVPVPAGDETPQADRGYESKYVSHAGDYSNQRYRPYDEAAMRKVRIVYTGTIIDN